MFSKCNGVFFGVEIGMVKLRKSNILAPKHGSDGIILASLVAMTCAVHIIQVSATAPNQPKPEPPPYVCMYVCMYVCVYICIYYIVFTSKRLPLQPVSSERDHQVADDQPPDDPSRMKQAVVATFLR